MNVSEAMTPRAEVVTVELPGSRDDALGYLQDGAFSSVPVVKPTDEGETYRGLVSRESLIENPDEDQLALLMEEVPTVNSDADLIEAARIMVEQHARRLPVVDDRLAGIVTVTDIVRAIADGSIDGGTPVNEVTTRAVTTTYGQTPMAVVSRQLSLADEPYAIVLDDEGEMAGMITEVDILQVAEIVDGEESTGASIADEDDGWMWEGIKDVGGRFLPTRNVEFPPDPVSEHMTPDVLTIAGQRSLQDAAQAMITNDLEQLPQVSGGRLVGIVRDIDLLRAL